MRVLHTADWHIGQTFHGYDRTYEHQQFLDWLVKLLKDQQIDVLLISGDVFDQSNPSASAIKLFYTFLNRAITVCPSLQVIITAGNHDSAARLESPKPLLESSNIHIIGLIEKDETGAINYNKITIPLKNKDGDVKAWCIAAPFLRMGDYPAIPDCDNPYTEGVATFYKEAYEYSGTLKQAGQVILAMGHLHAQKAETVADDKTERPIMGGVECISAAAFHEGITYVALGHIHKAQCIGGMEHVQYCGSPLPMSFSELNYKHQVIVFDLEEKGIGKLESIEIPLSVSLQRVPPVHSTLTEVISVLQQLPASGTDPQSTPYIEVCVMLDGPEPGLRHKIETAMTGKDVRLARIDARYFTAEPTGDDTAVVSEDRLRELQPKDIFEKVYQSRYNNTVPAELLQLFNQAAQEAAQSETV